MYSATEHVWYNGSYAIYKEILFLLLLLYDQAFLATSRGWAEPRVRPYLYNNVSHIQL